MHARWLAVLLLSAGCTVAPLEEKSFAPATNTCNSDAQCAGGTCDVGLGLCRATQGQFSQVLIEVTPPSNAKSWSNLAFIMPTDVSPGGGPLELALEPVAKVTGTVTPSGSQGSCMYGATQNSTSAPATVTFSSSKQIPGLGVQKYTANAALDPISNEFEFSLSLPPDQYDVYVEPGGDDADVPLPSCAIVPQLVRGVSLAGAATLPIPLQEPKKLSVDVIWPTGGVNHEEKIPLEGWLIEVVDPVGGLRLSVPVELAYTADATDPDNQHYTADVFYTEATGSQADAGKEIVRIRPPEGVPGPTVAIERAVLELLSAGTAKIEALQKLPAPKKLDLLSLYDSDGKPLAISAKVRFVSSKLNVQATEGTFAFYETTVDATDGVAKDVTLLPGQYDVLVAPTPGSGYASTLSTLTIGDKGLQGGKTATVTVVSKLGGSVAVPSGGSPVVGASVQAAASPVALTPQDIAVAAAPFAPQATAGLVGSNGKFLLEADPGIFDFSVRPAESSRFAWLVRPNVDVQSGQNDLGAMTLPLPVVYQGSVTVPNADPSASPLPVPGSLIRAFVFLDGSGYTNDRAEAKAVLQVAETRARDDGSFELLLPAHLN